MLMQVVGNLVPILGSDQKALADVSHLVQHGLKFIRDRQWIDERFERLQAFNRPLQMRKMSAFGRVEMVDGKLSRGAQVVANAG
jgi:hypothetical protein